MTQLGACRLAKVVMANKQSGGKVGRWIRLRTCDCIYILALVLLMPWLLWRSATTGRYRRGIRQRLLGLRPSDLQIKAPAESADQRGFAACDDSPTTRFGGDQVREGDAPVPKKLWLHGVSVGEVQLLAPLARALRQHHPEFKVVVSTSTDSGMELAAKLLPDLPQFYFPADLSWAIERTLNTLEPDMIVLGELELWPNLIDIAHARDIPMAVVNGRLSQKSWRGYRKLRWLTQPMFEKLTLVAAQNDEYAQRFIDCGCSHSRVVVTGSVKFDNVGFDVEAPEVQALRRTAAIQPSDRVLVIGSTQAPEEMVACNAFLKLRSEVENLKLILVPRHPDRFDQVARELDELPLRAVRRSALDSSDHAGATQPNWDVLLVDTVGELRWWWGLADIAIVGGSFGSRGGQNMLEPAAYGCNVGFGPNTSNFRDIVELLRRHDAADVIPNLESMEGWLRREFADPIPGQRRGANAQQLIERQQGALQRTLDQLFQIVGSSSNDASTTLPAPHFQRHAATTRSPSA